MKKLFTYNFSVATKINRFYRIVFFILSSVYHSTRRYKAKNTWIKLCLKFSCNYYFVIATKNNLKKINDELNNDLLGVDIVDSYYNLTILTANIYKYCSVYKLQSDFIIKNDDDIYPNIPLILIYINLYIEKIKISGFYYPHMKVRRDKNSSVYLPQSVYPYKTFPAFVAGGFVITHNNLINPIYFELKKQRSIIYREDMHLSIIYKKLNISFQSINKYYHRKENKKSLKIKTHDICVHGV